MPDVAAAIDYARRQLAALDPRLTYHDAAHTADNVVPAVELLAADERLDERTLLLLRTAAWFHDLGYLVRYDANEGDAVAIAEAILPGFGYEAREVDEVADLIWATRIPQQPTSLAGEILADADLFVLGTDRFDAQQRALQRELAAHGRPVSDDEWLRAQVRHLDGHRYFTAAARRRNDPGKAANRAALLAMLAR